MALPPDFDHDLWLDPLSFFGLVGTVCAQSKVSYRDLFREDGFAKPKADLMKVPGMAVLAFQVVDAKTWKELAPLVPPIPPRSSVAPIRRLLSALRCFLSARRSRLV